MAFLSIRRFLLFFYNRQNDGKMVKQELKVKLKRQRECFACV